MKVTGQCQCGAIRYEAEIDPAKVSACHCTDCQQFSGAPYRVGVPAPKESFRLLSGTPKIYVKTAESGNKRRQAFCGTCGTQLWDFYEGRTLRGAILAAAAGRQHAPSQGQSGGLQGLGQNRPSPAH